MEAMTTQLGEYKAELELVKKQAMDDNKKDNPKEAALRLAMDEQDPKKKEAAMRKAMNDMKEEKTAEDDKKDTPKEAAIKSAMDEDDSEKRKAAVKKAMNMKDEEKTAEEDEEKKEMKAELLSLRHEAALPKLTRLAAIYKNANIEESKFKTLSASWLEMSVPQLNAELERVEPFVSKYEATTATDSIPVSQTKDMFSFDAATKSDKITAIDNAKSVDLFNQRRGVF